MNNGYKLMRSWFDFAFENPDKVSPNHTALFAWFVELNNRMGWAEKFVSPASQAMAATGMKSYNTYSNTYTDLLKFGFVIEIVKSKNQFTACVIALSEFNKAINKALDNAINNTPAEPLPEPNATAEPKQAVKPVRTKAKTTDSINKPKTPKPKKPKTVPAKPASNTKLYNEAKKIFITVHLEKCKSGEYYFQAVDGKKITSLIEKITFKIKERQPGKVDFTLQEMSDAFLYFFTMAYDSGNEWLKSNFTLSNLDAQFNPVYTNIKNYANKTNKANGSGNGKAASPDGIIDAINKRYNPGPDTNNG